MMGLKKIFLSLFCSVLLVGWASAQDTTDTSQGSYFLSFVKKVYFNPTILLATQDFREQHNVRVLVLPDLNGAEENQITGFERGMQKIIRFLIEGDDEGSFRFYFDGEDTESPFSFVCAEELWCKFTTADRDSIERLLNAPFNNAEYDLNSHALFEVSIEGALDYAGNCLQHVTAQCGEMPEHATTEIKTKPLSISVHATQNTLYDLDHKQFDLLESNYAKAHDVFTDQDWYAPAKYMVSGASDEPIAIAIDKHETLFKKQNIVFRTVYNNQVIPIEPSSTNDTIKLKLPADLPSGNPVEVVVKYTSTVDSLQYTVGFFMVYVYEPKTVKVNLLAANGYTIDEAAILNELKTVYDPVGITFDLDKKEWMPDSEWPVQVDIESSGLLSNYPADLRDWVTGVQELNDYDEEEYYLVFGLSTAELTGYMPRARNIGFVFSGEANHGKVAAHELGHGRYHLRHIFAEEELGTQAFKSTGNIMDYSDDQGDDLHDLYLHQWKFIDDPASVSWFGGDDEESMSYSSQKFTWDTDSLPPIGLSNTNASTIITFGSLTEDPILKISEDQFARFKADQLSGKTATFSGEVVVKFEYAGKEMRTTGNSYTLSKETKEAFYDGPSSVFFCQTCSSERTYDTTLVDSDTKRKLNLIDKYSPNDILPASVNCQNVEGYYVPEGNELIFKYPVCPPSGQIALLDPDEMAIPHNWKFTDANNKRCVSFMCPDKSFIKLDVTQVKKARFTVGLENSYNLEALADGFLLNFVFDDGTGEKTYTAKIENHQFKGYYSDGQLFGGNLPLLNNEFAVMLLPYGVERVPYKIKYTSTSVAYNATSNNPVIEIFKYNLSLQEEEDLYMSLKIADNSSSIERIGSETYYLDEAKYGMNSYGADLFESVPRSNYEKINHDYWLVSKISQLKSKYPFLYPKMTQATFMQWDGWTEAGAYTTLVNNMGTIAINWVFDDAVTDDPVENYFMTTENLTAGYFDYVFTKFGWKDFARTPKEKFHLGKFFKFYKRLIRLNKELNQVYIDAIKNIDNCFNTRTSPITVNSVPLNTTQIYNGISCMSVEELQELCNVTRVQLIRHLMYPGIENLWLVTNGLEKTVLRVLDNTPDGDLADLLENLCETKPGGELLIKTMADAIDDETCFWGDDYFSEMVRWVTKAYAGYQGNSLKNRYESNTCTREDLTDLKQRICVYNYTWFVKRLGKGLWYSAANNLGLTLPGNPLSQYVVPDPDKMTSADFNEFDQIVLLNYSERCFINVSSETPRYLGQMEPVFIDDKGNLMDVYAQSKGVLMPAVSLYFIEKAADSKTTVAVIQTVVDVVTLFIPGAGPIKLLTYADKLSSVSSLTASYFEDDNPELAKTLNIFSAVLGITDLANTSSVASKFDKFQELATNSDKALDYVKASNMTLATQQTKLDELLTKFETKDAELMTAITDPEAKIFAKRALAVEEAAAASNLTVQNRIRKVINSIDNLGAFANHSFYVTFGNKLKSYWGGMPSNSNKLYRKAGATGNVMAEINTQGKLIIYKNGPVTWGDIKGSECIDILPSSSYKLSDGATVTDEISDLTVYKKTNGELICSTGGNCFTAGTKVRLADGRTIFIQDIQVGDVVMSFDEASAGFMPNKVVRLFKKTTDKLVRLVTPNDTIWATLEHPFYTAKGWMSAGTLVSGTLLHTISGVVPVQEVFLKDTIATVYNFEVDQAHTYLVGNEGYVVHNTCAYRQKLLDDGLDPFMATRLQTLSNFHPNVYEKIKNLDLSVAKVTDFLNDFGDNAALLAKFENNVLDVKAWQVLSNLTGARSWVRKSEGILAKMTGKSDDLMDKVKSYYSNHQKPAGMGTPPFVHQGTPFDEFGHPNFVPEVPAIGSHGKIKYQPDATMQSLTGGSADFTNASNWAEGLLNVNGEINFVRVPNSTRFKVKSPNSPFADENGWVECVWHHHEDAKTLLPVPMQTHNRSFTEGSPHTGGAAILDKPALHDLIGFFNSPVGI